MRFAVLGVLALLVPTVALTRAADLHPASALKSAALKPAPEFVVQLTNGQQVLLSSLRGKVIALEFLYTTCPHCQHASQVFTQLAKEYGPRGFEPVGVAFNPMSQMLVNDFVRDFKVGYTVGYSERDRVLDFLAISPLERFVVPQIVWIDRKGMIRSQTPANGDNTEMYQEPYWRHMIETLTAEHAGAAHKPASHRVVHTARR